MSEEEKAPTTESNELTVSQQIEKLKDTPEFAAILNQHGKTYHELKAEESGGSFMGKAYNNVDTALMEELGLEERPKGKTTELVRQLAKEKKALEAKLANTAKEDNGKETEEAKQQLHNSQLSALQQQIEELTKSNQSLMVKGKDQRATNSLVNGLTGESFDPNLSNSVLTEIKAMRIKNAVSNSKEVEGKIVFYMDDGNPYTNLNGLPMSAKEVGQVLFKDIIHTKKAGGNANGDDKPQVKGDIVVLPNPENIKSFTQFNKEFEKAMRAKGLTRADKKYYELQRATRDHYKFEGLPTE